MTGPTLARLFELSGNSFTRNLDGIGRAESLAVPPGGGSSINWIVGHILRSREARIVSTLGLESIWSDPRQELYTNGKTPADTEGREVPIGEMIRRFDRSQPLLVHELSEKSDADLAKPLDEPHEKFGSTVGELVTFFAYHEIYHVGQLASVRRIVAQG